MIKTILVGSMNGQTYIYNILTQQLIPYNKLSDKGIMGLASNDQYLFIASRNSISKQKHPKTNNELPLILHLSTDKPEFHQLLLYKQKIYITCTALN